MRGDAMTRGNLAEKPIYIEMLGPSGVGKTTVANLVAADLVEWRVLYRGGLKNREWQNLFAALRSWKRLRRFIKFYYYLRNHRNVPRQLARRRAAAVTGIPVPRPFIRRGSCALVVEEGPVGYLSSCGGFGEPWKEWVEVLLPEGLEVQAFFIMLTASPEELERRRAKRGRPDKVRTLMKGTEGLTEEMQHRGKQYWLSQLTASGAFCKDIITDSRSAEDIAQEVCAFVRNCLLAADGSSGGLASREKFASLQPLVARWLGCR